MQVCIVLFVLKTGVLSCIFWTPVLFGSAYYMAATCYCFMYVPVKSLTSFFRAQSLMECSILSLYCFCCMIIMVLPLPPQLTNRSSHLSFNPFTVTASLSVCLFRLGLVLRIIFFTFHLVTS